MEGKMEMIDETKNKLEIDQDLIIQLYKNNIIIWACKMDSRKKSDIDV